MSYWETIFFWITMVIFALTGGGFIYSFVFKNPRVIQKLTYLVAVAFVTMTITIGCRFVATGHLPWSGDYESALMGGWIIIAATLYVGWRNKAMQGLSAATVPLVLIMMGFGYMRNPVLTPMAASLKTVWLYIHVYFAQLAFGSYALAMATGVLYLLKSKDALRPTQNPSYLRFPSTDRLDELIFRYIVFGFITDTIMISVGELLELGPGRNLVAHLLAHLRCLHPPAGHLRLARHPARMAGGRRAQYGDHRLLRRHLRGQLQHAHVQGKVGLMRDER